MFTRAQTFLILFVAALVAGAFFALVLDAGPFIDGALAGLVAVLVLAVLQRYRARTAAGGDGSAPRGGR
jgi:membrane protein implicated in regulation of membrane protease activity